MGVKIRHNIFKNFSLQILAILAISSIIPCTSASWIKDFIKHPITFLKSATHKHEEAVHNVPSNDKWSQLQSSLDREKPAQTNKINVLDGVMYPPPSLDTEESAQTNKINVLDGVMYPPPSLDTDLSVMNEETEEKEDGMIITHCARYSKKCKYVFSEYGLITAETAENKNMKGLIWHKYINWDEALPKIITKRAFFSKPHESKVTITTGQGALLEARQLNLMSGDQAVALLPGYSDSKMGELILVVVLKPHSRAVPIAILQHPKIWIEKHLLPREMRVVDCNDEQSANQCKESFQEYGTETSKIIGDKQVEPLIWDVMINWEEALPKVLSNKIFQLAKHEKEKVDVITGKSALATARQLNLSCEGGAVAILPSADCSIIGPAILVVKLKPNAQNNEKFDGIPIALLLQPILWMRRKILPAEDETEDQKMEVVDCKQNADECKLIFNEYTKEGTVNQSMVEMINDKSINWDETLQKIMKNAFQPHQFDQGRVLVTTDSDFSFAGKELRLTWNHLPVTLLPSMEGHTPKPFIAVVGLEPKSRELENFIPVPIAILKNPIKLEKEHLSNNGITQA